ncbi:DUF2461 domain-containing protein [Streptomyces sp. NPDC101132]|uniref:DUF2461 domain-containing protein n=1 Tax=Streptomyces sp. NPDC101132 TaxID=3366110 RepID=UPI003821097E
MASTGSRAPTGTSRFTGFPPEAFAFYEGLAADNSKEFWSAHKETYETAVREPMLALAAELEAEFGPAKVFRPYRDVRFSHDKSPYKTQQGAHTSQGFYVAVDADGLLVAAGLHSPTGEQLTRYRAAVDADAPGKELEAVLAKLSKAGFELAGDRLKTRPRGVAADHPRLDLLRHRSLYAHRGWPPDPWVGSREALKRVRTSWRALRPLTEWCRTHAGAGEG